MKQNRIPMSGLLILLGIVVIMGSFQNCGPSFATRYQASQTQEASRTPDGLTAMLAWDKSTSPGVSGYRIYLGSQSRSYQTVIDAGPTSNPSAPTYSVSDLVPNTTYYAVVKAYNSNGQESLASNEIQFIAE